MPFALFWYILRDLLKVLVLSTIVLVTVISFGAAIKPLSEGVLGPWALLKFILLTIPPMLQFALPFSAAFSATLVYHRMTSDNEMVACAANGVSFSQLLLPAAALGVALTIGLSFLANYANPFFWEAMARAARIDGAELICRTIERGEPVRTKGFWVYADEAKRVEPPPGVEADTVIWLKGLVVAYVKKGRLVRDGVAREGYFYLTRRGGSTVLTCSIVDAAYHDLETSTRWFARGVSPEEYVIPDTQLDQPKFMNLNRLREVTTNKEDYWRIADQVDELRRWVARRRLFDEIDASLHAAGRVTLHSVQYGAIAGEIIQERFVLYGRGLDRSRGKVYPLPGESSCRIVQFDRGGQPMVEYRARTLGLVSETNVLLDEPTVRFRLQGATIRDLSHADPISNARKGLELPGLQWSNPIMESLRQIDIDTLVATARTMEDEAVLHPMFVRINDEYTRLESAVLSRLHERTAMPVSCLVMMVLGATLAIAMRSALPLTIYFWSFLPAIVGVLLVSAGLDLVQEPGVSNLYGLCVMWSGNLGMSVMILIILRRLMRT